MTPTASTSATEPAALSPAASRTATGHERILDAAAARFAEFGYAETSLRLIAADIEMKAGSLYYHFASKDDLFVSVLDRGIALMIEGFERVERQTTAQQNGGGGDDGDRARLAAHVRMHLGALHGNFAFTSLHVTNFRTAPASVRSAIVPARDAYEAKWTTLLTDLLPGRSEHEIGILRLVLFGSMNSSIDWFDAERGNLDQFASVVTDQFWSGASQPRAAANPGSAKEQDH